MCAQVTGRGKEIRIVHVLIHHRGRGRKERIFRRRAMNGLRLLLRQFLFVLKVGGRRDKFLHQRKVKALIVFRRQSLARHVGVDTQFNENAKHHSDALG